MLFNYHPQITILENQNDHLRTESISSANANKTETPDKNSFSVSLYPPSSPFSTSETMQKKEDTTQETETNNSTEYIQESLPDFSPNIAMQTKMNSEGEEEAKLEPPAFALEYAGAPDTPPDPNNYSNAGEIFNSTDSLPIQKVDNTGASTSINSSADLSNQDGESNDILQKMGTSFGQDFSNINISTNSSKASDVNALAYTQGNDIHFAPGQFSPSTQSGQELLGHELTHVIQQREGRVKPNTQATNGMAMNNDPGLEKEADVMGAEAASSIGPAQFKKISNVVNASSNSFPIQMTPGDNNDVAGVENQVQTGESDNYSPTAQEIEGSHAEQMARNYINGLTSVETAQTENVRLLAASDGVQSGTMVIYHAFMLGLPSQGIHLIQSDYDGIVILMHQKIQQLVAQNQISPEDYQEGLNLTPEQELERRRQLSLSSAGILRGFDGIYGRMKASAINQSHITYQEYMQLGSNSNAAATIFEELTHAIYDEGRDRLIEAAVGDGALTSFISFGPILQGMTMLHEESQWNQRDDEARRAYRTHCIFNYLLIQYAQTVAEHDPERNAGQVIAVLNDQVSRYEGWMREEEPELNQWARENMPQENQTDSIGPA